MLDAKRCALADDPDRNRPVVLTPCRRHAPAANPGACLLYELAKGAKKYAVAREMLE